MVFYSIGVAGYLLSDCGTVHLLTKLYCIEKESFIFGICGPNA